MLLKIGSRGEDVKTLQEKLGIVADGDFGPGTANSVKNWQSANGLTADGEVGDSTWNALLGTATPAVATSSSFNLDALKGHVPDSIIAQIPDTASRFNISSKLRLCHFLAQCKHESGGFKITQENLNYSADGLKSIFGRYFPGTLNESYARQPQKIANRVYANRMGNGDEASGDGWKFSGKGSIQLTGRDNYSRFSQFIGEECVANPELVATKYPLASAAFFFNNNGLWPICDRGADAATIEAVTRKVNGGILGLPERSAFFQEFYSLAL